MPTILSTNMFYFLPAFPTPNKMRSSKYLSPPFSHLLSPFKLNQFLFIFLELLFVVLYLLNLSSLFCFPSWFSSHYLYLMYPLHLIFKPQIWIWRITILCLNSAELISSKESCLYCSWILLHAIIIIIIYWN